MDYICTHIIRTFFVSLVVLVAPSVESAESKIASASALSPKDIFTWTNIWTIHLRFTPDQWEAMEPKQATGQRRGFGGGSWLQGPEGGRNGLSASQGLVFDYVRADLEFGTNQFKEVGVRYKGNGTFWSSRESLKRSLKIDFNQFVKLLGSIRRSMN